MLVDAAPPVPASLMTLLAGLAPLFTAPSFAPAAAGPSHLPHLSPPSGTGRIVCLYLPYKGSNDTR
jgi:hypothetical protein